MGEHADHLVIYTSVTYMFAKTAFRINSCTLVQPVKSCITDPCVLLLSLPLCTHVTSNSNSSTAGRQVICAESAGPFQKTAVCNYRNTLDLSADIHRDTPVFASVLPRRPWGSLEIIFASLFAHTFKAMLGWRCFFALS